jgi:hypothetical protein
MAQDYEVREEFKDNSLSQLMDSSVLCFQGVGEIQTELLKQYFGIATVRDLANWAQFLWALEIQELALHGGELAHTAIREFPAGAQPKFKVRERAEHMTPEQLMMSSVQELDGLTPAQDLALYDIFRITNIAQLAHNRIMLEARVIQYLHGQSGAPAAPEPEQERRAVDSVLARPQVSAAGAAQRVMEARTAGRDEGLVAMAKETREHVGERLAALRERARMRATVPEEGQAAAEAGAAAGAAPSRLESVRAIHERAEGTVSGQRLAGERAAALVSRRTTVAAAVGGQRGGLDASRGLARAGAAGAPVGGMTSRTAAVLAARGAAAPGAAQPEGATVSRAAAVLAARGGGAAAAAAGGPGSARAGAPAPSAREGGAAVQRPSPTVAPAPSPAAAPAAAPPPAAPAVAPAAGVPTERRGIPPALWVAAAVLVVVAGVLIFALRGREQPTPSGTTAPGVATQTGSAPQPGAAGQAGGAPQVATGAGQQTRPAPAGMQGPASAPGAGKTIHTVREGQSLWRISRRYYQLGHEWPIIYKENQDQIDEPNLIFPKQRFAIPPKP